MKHLGLFLQSVSLSSVAQEQNKRKRLQNADPVNLHRPATGSAATCGNKHACNTRLTYVNITVLMNGKSLVAFGRSTQWHLLSQVGVKDDYCLTADLFPKIPVFERLCASLTLG